MDLSPYLLVIKQAAKKKKPAELHLTAEDLKVVDFDQIFNSSPKKRLQAIEALVASDYPNKLRLLLQLMHQETDLQLKFEIRKALNQLQSDEEFWGDDQPENLRRLRKALKSERIEHAKAACRYILDHRLTEFLSLTLELENRFKDPYFQQVNLQLMSFKGSIHAPRILGYLRSSQPDVITAAIKCLGQVGSQKLLLKIFPFIEHSSPKVREQVGETLQSLGKDRFLSLLETLINAPNPKRRSLALLTIEFLHLESARLLLEILLEDPEESIRLHASRILKSFQNASASESTHLHLPRKYSIEEVSNKIHSSVDSSSLSNLLRELRDADGKDDEKLKIFMSFVAHPDDRVRANAVEYMAPFIPRGHHSFFLPFLEDSDHRTRGNAIVALGHDSEVYQSFKDQVSTSLIGLARSSRSIDQLTSLYCMGILCDEFYLDECLSLLESPNPAVSLKAREVLESWGQVSNEVFRRSKIQLERFERFLASESYQEQEPEGPPPEQSTQSKESMVQLWERIRSTLDFEDKDKKSELLKELKGKDRDLALAGVLQDYLRTEKDTEILSLLIDTIHQLGPEDPWALFHQFLTHSDSAVVFSAVCSLVESDSFRMIPVLAQRMRETDVDEGKNGEILFITMVQMILLKEPLAVKAMKTLANGSQNSMLYFSLSLKYWIRPPDILLRDVSEVLFKANQEKTIELCLEYLRKFTNPENYKGKVELALKKTKSETARKVLKAALSTS